MGCPLPPYIKEQGGRGGRPGGVLLPPGVGLPPFLVGLGEGGKRRERGRKGGAAPLLVQFGLEGEGARGLPWPPLLFSTKAHVGPLNPRGGSGNPRYSGIYLITPETIPVSEYSRPIYHLHVYTISRLLVMSVITSGTPNYLWYIKTYKLII